MEEFNGKYKKQFNYIVSHYQFRFNVVTSLYEYRKLELGKRKNTRLGSQWKEFDDRKRTSILLELLHLDLELSQDKFNIFVESETVSPDYNPFIEYFESLDPWDQKTDYIEQLSKTVFTFDSEHFKSTLQRFFIGALDCLLEEDAVNDVCLVFQSEQGVGKTRWMRKLMPPKFRKEYFYEGNIDTRNKDHTMYLGQYWFIHLDELETLKSNDISAIKSYITRQRISERKAFGRYRTRYIRRASFLGSVNDDKFLTDITGNRRWLVFKVTDINYEHDVDIDKMWAQIYHLWKEGFKHWFDITEIKVINKINEEFRSMSIEEEMLLKYYAFDKPEDRIDAGEYLASSDVLTMLCKDNGHLMSKMNAGSMGRALAKHSKDKKRRNGVQKFYVTWRGLDLAPDKDPNWRDDEASQILENERLEKPLIQPPKETFNPADDDEMPF